ncbi:MAG TPA: hypothetical protein DDW68_13315 [Verrucomicrobiales bacterium]|nr:hypothetical protein [Verrucomicrobiales bacterium]
MLRRKPACFSVVPSIPRSRFLVIVQGASHTSVLLLNRMTRCFPRLSSAFPEVVTWLVMVISFPTSSVMSHYEFITNRNTRVDDDEWKQKLPTGHYPKRGDWRRACLVSEPRAE